MEVLLQACSLLLDCAFNEKDEQIFTNHKRKWFEKENVFEKTWFGMLLTVWTERMEMIIN